MPRRAPTFAARLRAMREAADLTQSQLAQQSRVSRQALSKLERGEREPTWETVRQLAHALGVNVTAFDNDEPVGASPSRLVQAARAYGQAYDQLEQKSRDVAMGSNELFARFQEAQVELNLAALDLFAAPPPPAVETTSAASESAQPRKPRSRSRRA